MPSKPLAARMRALADAGHPRAAELRERATDLDQAVKAASASAASPEVRALLGAWARARRLWCETTGEPLV